MAKSKSDIAVIGLRSFGSRVARTLQQTGRPVLGIDPDIRRVEDIVDELAQAVALDPSDEDALAQIDIASFDIVIVALAHDFELMVLTVATLKELGIQRVICEAETNRQSSILLKIGAAEVILPHQIASNELAKRLTEE